MHFVKCDRSDIKAHPDFSLATLIIDVVAIVMAAIMIYHIKSKYTAVGKSSEKRKNRMDWGDEVFIYIFWKGV